MKRPLDENPSAVEDLKKKKRKEEEEMAEETRFIHLDSDLLFEVLKHVDARSLATAACVSKQWHKTAQDERLWEMICTRHWANTGCVTQQLRAVVLALGGFRRLHSIYLRPLLKPQQPKTPVHWGIDEVRFSLSLHCFRYDFIPYHEKMNLNKRGR
ncbi:F-box protein GID2-like [Magnolia sinica]|uniref:F-box protein GID2-like n=1 Tax=Magnolia sinica TaxID=86752 RepID=UPI00265B13C6|nr:F-box protein GID2-like [Magnolia sinica]